MIEQPIWFKVKTVLLSFNTYVEIRIHIKIYFRSLFVKFWSNNTSYILFD